MMPAAVRALTTASSCTIIEPKLTAAGEGGDVITRVGPTGCWAGAEATACWPCGLERPVGALGVLDTRMSL